MKQPIKPIILPTEDYTGIVLHSTGLDNILHIKKSAENAVLNIGGQHQHLYITVSQDVEPIKEGDNIIEQTGLGYMPPSIATEENMAVKEYINRCRKIIATDDPKLLFEESIYDPRSKTGGMMIPTGMPQVPQSFLKEYVANPDGRYEVKYENYYENNRPMNNRRLVVNQDNTVTITSVKEKMYSREDVMLHLYNLAGNIAFKNSITIDGNYITNWIKENL